LPKGQVAVPLLLEESERPAELIVFEGREIEGAIEVTSVIGFIPAESGNTNARLDNVLSMRPGDHICNLQVVFCLALVGLGSPSGKSILHDNFWDAGLQASRGGFCACSLKRQLVDQVGCEHKLVSKNQIVLLTRPIHGDFGEIESSDSGATIGP